MASLSGDRDADIECPNPECNCFCKSYFQFCPECLEQLDIYPGFRRTLTPDLNQTHNEWDCDDSDSTDMSEEEKDSVHENGYEADDDEKDTDTPLFPVYNALPEEPAVPEFIQPVDNADYATSLDELAVSSSTNASASQEPLVSDSALVLAGFIERHEQTYTDMGHISDDIINLMESMNDSINGLRFDDNGNHEAVTGNSGAEGSVAIGSTFTLSGEDHAKAVSENLTLQGDLEDNYASTDSSTLADEEEVKLQQEIGSNVEDNSNSALDDLSDGTDEYFWDYYESVYATSPIHIPLPQPSYEYLI